MAYDMAAESADRAGDDLYAFEDECVANLPQTESNLASTPGA